MTGAYSTIVYFVPLYFQSVRGVSAVQSGVRTLALVIALGKSALWGALGCRKRFVSLQRIADDIQLCFLSSPVALSGNSATLSRISS